MSIGCSVAGRHASQRSQRRQKELGGTRESESSTAKMGFLLGQGIQTSPRPDNKAGVRSGQGGLLLGNDSSGTN